MIIPPAIHEGRISHLMGGPPGRSIDTTPLTNWVKVADPILSIIVLTTSMINVLTGMEITAYNPGREAGIKLVVNVLNAEMHPNIEENAISLEDKRGFLKAFNPPFYQLSPRKFLFHP